MNIKTPNPNSLNCYFRCPHYSNYVNGLFEIIHEPLGHLLETEIPLQRHLACLQAYRQRRKSRIAYLLQPNLHLNSCLLCKNYVYKELYYVWGQVSCCELNSCLPQPVRRLLKKYKESTQFIIPNSFVFTLFLIEKYNDVRNLDTSMIVYDMCKESYIEKVKQAYRQNTGIFYE